MTDPIYGLVVLDRLHHGDIQQTSTNAGLLQCSMELASLLAALA